MKVPAIAAIMAASFALAPSLADASVPAVLGQQGRLFNAEGQPIDGEVRVVYALYDALDGGTQRWTEAQTLVVEDGYFTTTLGSTTPIDAAVFADGKMYLSLKIEDDEEMTPRAQLVSVPFALLANDAVGDIHPKSVTVGGTLVIDEEGNWIGDVAGLQGEAGEAGPAGPAGPAGAVGPAGAPGTPGAAGPAGAVGPQGDVGAIGPMGPQGDVGAIGPMGPQGPAGSDGAMGPIGPQGPEGANGLDGATGPMGPQGPAGSDGAIGPQGATGPMGPIGPEGANGLDGATGPMGPQGPAGLNGLDGATGPMGPQGPMGPEGANGLDGATGPMGPQGPAGLNGLDGATGPMGPQGPMGPAGLNGLDGATGPMGPQGPAGLNGLDGATGPMGPQGPAGLNGIDGVNGLDGATGPMGPQGPAGLNGIDGVNGLDGATGPMGPQGVQGPAGPAGSGSSTATYRYVTFDTWDDSWGWIASNDASLFGGVQPSAWGDGNATAGMISPDKEIQRAFFTNQGRARSANAMILSETRYNWNATGGRLVAVLFRVRNTTGAPIDWTLSSRYTAFSAWGESFSVALNGADVYTAGSTNYIGTSLVLPIPAGRTSSVIVVAGSGNTADLRTLHLSFGNNSLALPPGLELVDDLDTAVGGYEQ